MQNIHSTRTFLFDIAIVFLARRRALSEVKYVWSTSFSLEKTREVIDDSGTKCKITDREYHLILPSFLPIYPIKAIRPLVPRALIPFVFTVETRHRSKMFLASFEGLGCRRIKGKLSLFTSSPSVLRLTFRRRTLCNYSRIPVMERRGS